MPPRTATRPTFRCGECGLSTPRWVGRCPECQAWGTLVETGAAVARAVAAGPVSAAARPIAEVDAAPALVRPTGVDELDRVLGGGLVPGAVVLVAGEPGVGKSTLLLDVAHRAARADCRSLLVSGEESAAQVRLRAGRMGALSPHLFLAAETDLSALLAHIDAVNPSLLVVDSVQTFTHPDADGSAGGVTQVREVAAALVRIAKERHIATLLVGHVTKDGGVAGPRLLEHIVDVVLQFEGDRHASLRMVRAVKNRFGTTDEVGCFQLSDDGITGVSDPSALFLSTTPAGRRGATTPGTCVTVTVEGRRPLVAEVQALVASNEQAHPRRGVSGLDAARFATVVAVVERRAGVKLSGCDVYAATVGGFRLVEPAVDLAMAIAVGGAQEDRAMPVGTIAVGEVGLTGEVRRVTALPRRLAEAARVGFRHAIVPAGSDTGPLPAGFTTTSVTNVHEALQLLKKAPALRAV